MGTEGYSRRSNEIEEEPTSENGEGDVKPNSGWRAFTRKATFPVSQAKLDELGEREINFLKQWHAIRSNIKELDQSSEEYEKQMEVANGLVDENDDLLEDASMVNVLRYITNQLKPPSRGIKIKGSF